MKAPDVTMIEVDEGQNQSMHQVTHQNQSMEHQDSVQEAVLKRVYKVGDQEYLLVKVQSAEGNELKEVANQGARKEKQESDYIKAIYGRSQHQQDHDNQSMMTFSVGGASIPDYGRSQSYKIPEQHHIQMHRETSERVYARDSNMDSCV